MESSLLTQEEFNAHRAHHTLRLSFIGMSNGGKSYHARALSNENDFLWYQVDTDIQKELGLEGHGAVSAWMGYPTSPTYPEREQRYLSLENKYTGHAAMHSPGKNLVFDTTGSVVHLDPSVLQRLRENTLVVHLDVGEESLDRLIEQFFKTPKPVAWSGHFSQRDGESEDGALRRCYPALLSERLKRYRALAHINIPAGDLRDKSGEETLAILRAHL